MLNQNRSINFTCSTDLHCYLNFYCSNCMNNKDILTLETKQLSVFLFYVFFCCKARANTNAGDRFVKLVKLIFSFKVIACLRELIALCEFSYKSFAGIDKFILLMRLRECWEYLWNLTRVECEPQMLVICLTCLFYFLKYKGAGYEQSFFL